MADMSANSGESSVFYKLLYDSRYRSLTIEVLILALLAALIWWLGYNLAVNLEANDKDISWTWLDNTAGFRVDPVFFMDLDTQDTHARAAVAAAINTFLVGIVGIVLATIFGVLAGVARLSKNWLVAKLMTVYVEGFRNVPLLLWIIIILAVFTEFPEQVRAFRSGDAEMMLFDSIAVTNRYLAMPALISEEGASVFWAVVLIGLAVAYGFGRYAKKRQMDTGEQLPAGWVALGVIVGSIVLGYLVSGGAVHLERPELQGFNFAGGLIIPNAMVVIIFALALYTGAFIAEIVRGGILAISHGQTEAAYALGIKPSVTMRKVVLPQAMRVIIPPLISQYLNLFKNSSLATAATFMDFTRVVSGISGNQTGRAIETMLIVGLFYLAISLFISAIMNVVNSRVKLKER